MTRYLGFSTVQGLRQWLMRLRLFSWLWGGHPLGCRELFRSVDSVDELGDSG